MANTTTRTNTQLAAILDNAATLYNDPQFSEAEQYGLGFEMTLGKPAPRNWRAYLWRAAYSQARLEQTNATAPSGCGYFDPWNGEPH